MSTKESVRHFTWDKMHDKKLLFIKSYFGCDMVAKTELLYAARTAAVLALNAGRA
jgi:hypothetical protein